MLPLKHNRHLAEPEAALVELLQFVDSLVARHPDHNQYLSQIRERRLRALELWDNEGRRSEAETLQIILVFDFAWLIQNGYASNGNDSG